MTDDRAEAFDAFCAAQYTQLVGAVHLLCGDLGVAEELVQTALERTWQRWDRVSAMVSSGGWTQQVAFNLARSRLRRRMAERRALARHGVTGSTEPVDTAGVLAVRRALLDVPVRQREALVHRYYGGLAMTEIAEVMGISEAAATGPPALGAAPPTT